MIFSLPQPTRVLEAELSPATATRLRVWFDALYSRAVAPSDVVAAIEQEFPT